MSPAIRILVLDDPDGPNLPDQTEVLIAHFVTGDGAAPKIVERDLKSLLHQTFGIAHSVLEKETARDACPNRQIIGH